MAALPAYGDNGGPKKHVQVDVSIAVAMYNASLWLEETLDSVLAQTFTGSMELSIFDDASTDSSLDIVKKWCPRLEARGMRVVIGSAGPGTGAPRGPGYGRNQAIRQSTGKYLCVLDADDVMVPERIEMQHAAAVDNPDALVGCCFSRFPVGSTERYTRWANSLTPSQLYTQAYTAFGPTVIQPTWFFAREVFKRVGPYSEEGKGTPEDLLFFYRHLSQGGKLVRVERPLVVYRHHPAATTFSVDRWTIWKLRVEAVQEAVLCRWSEFTIWNAGKQGRRLYRSLRPDNQAKFLTTSIKVMAFCDVDPKKIARGYYTHEESEKVPKPKVLIVHFIAARPPFLLCVKWDLTGGEFESNLRSLNLQEGRDYYHFS